MGESKELIARPAKPGEARVAAALYEDGRVTLGDNSKPVTDGISVLCLPADSEDPLGTMILIRTTRPNGLMETGAVVAVCVDKAVSRKLANVITSFLIRIIPGVAAENWERGYLSIEVAKDAVDHQELLSDEGWQRLMGTKTSKTYRYVRFLADAERETEIDDDDEDDEEDDEE